MYIVCRDHLNMQAVGQYCWSFFRVQQSVQHRVRHRAPHSVRYGVQHNAQHSLQLKCSKHPAMDLMYLLGLASGVFQHPKRDDCSWQPGDRVSASKWLD